MRIKHVIRKNRVRLLLILSAVALGIMGSCVVLVRFTNNILCSPGFGLFNIEAGLGRGPYAGIREDIDHLDQSLEWTPDGSHIIFGATDDYRGDFHEYYFSPRTTRIQIAAADGSSLVSISNDGEFDISGSPAVSPDGSRIAYSIYRYMDGDTEYPDTFERYFEIETSALDGSNRRRLTEKKGFDLYPAWSPSGDRIAFTRQSVPNCALSFDILFPSYGRTIHVMNVDGSEVHEVLKESDAGDGVDIMIEDGGLQWSPDGRSLALFVDMFIPPRMRRTSLITVEANGSGWMELASEAERSYVGGRLEPSAFRGSVAWSPDSRRLAFMKHEDGITTLYTVERDGTGLRAVTALSAGSNDLSGALSWSPDGSEIRFFVTDPPSQVTTLYVVNVDGSNLRSSVERLGERPEGIPSPDGSRIAVLAPFDRYYDVNTVILSTASSDGTDVRVLVRTGGNGVFEAVGPDQKSSVTVASCSAGVVVADPDANPGLVRDCEALVKMVDRLAVVGLNWDADTPISEWTGVLSDSPAGFMDGPNTGTGSSPARVRGLSLSGLSLGYPFPDAVTELTGLRLLDLSVNGLYGDLPSELGGLSELRVLRLDNNGLRGPIPSELGNLRMLEELDLRENSLGGSIPSELGNLSSLRVLHLRGNYLSGEIPAELGNLSSLRELHLGRNNLSGPIPSELGNLSALNVLELRGLRGLTGCIPAALADRLFASDGLLMGNHADEWFPKCGE